MTTTQFRLLAVSLFVALPLPPQPHQSLERSIDIAWHKGPDLPQGFQDSSGGVLEDMLVSVGGFCSGETNVPGKPNRYPRGFLKKVWGLPLSDPGAGWVELPDFPSAARQGLACVAVNGSLHCWGGFSYSDPFTYKDGYRLSRQAGRWAWARLPDLPSPTCSSGICAIGSKIYLFGGADYDSERFYTRADRSGANKRLGARLLLLDTNDLASGWKPLTESPGTPRFGAATAAAGGRIFVIGGAAGDGHRAKAGAYSTVVDNWMYDPGSGRWQRLRDLPVASGNFPSGRIAYGDRYILLVGGAQYSQVEAPDGTLRPPYGITYKHYKDKSYFSDVWVYDTQTGLFGTATPLPLNNNMPMAVLDGSKIYLIGGETGGSVIDGEHFGHHPDLLLIGDMRLRKR